MQSHPLWVRGLKLLRKVDAQLFNVASFMGAWIETCDPAFAAFAKGRILYGCVD